MVPEKAAQPSVGMREEDWPTTPEGIAALLARMDKAEPLEVAAEEEADLAAWRKKQKEYEMSKWEGTLAEDRGTVPMRRYLLDTNAAGPLPQQAARRRCAGR